MGDVSTQIYEKYKVRTIYTFTECFESTERHGCLSETTLSVSCWLSAGDSPGHRILKGADK